MDLVSFSIAIMLRKTNVKLLLMLIVVIICIIIILMSSQLTSPKQAPYFIRDKYVQNIEFPDEPERHRNAEEIADDPVVFSESDTSSNLIINSKSTSVAIGLAVTSHDEPNLSLENVGYKLPFLRTLVPSFCRTASTGFNYHFYVAFDVHDPHFSLDQYMVVVDKFFHNVLEKLCPKTLNVSLHFVQCNHNRNPAWAQNDAMMEAYLDHIDYYYRVNDDTEMLSPGWTETFINALQDFSPPNVGVVGPLHKGGNEAILTYDFVHRNHIDIFGYYYPRVFTDWWADNWISQVYDTARTRKVPGVRLLHTGEAGQRYEVKHSNEKFLKEQIEEDRIILNRYLQAVEEASKRTDKTPKEKLVISMSLWGTKPRYTYGALRNAQLLPVHFPGWQMRVYVERPRADRSTSFSPSPPRLLAKLAVLGVELVYVDAARSHVPPMMWRFLIADDMTVDAFVVRDSDCRLNDRDFAVVSDWLSTDYAFHCVRDHPSHAMYSVLGGLWGGRPRRLRSFVAVPWRDLMMGYRTDYVQDMQFLANAIWPSVQARGSYCHDSVSCLDWVGAHPFPFPRVGTEHLGQVFDAFGNARDEDLQILLEHRPVPQCTIPRNTSGAVESTSKPSVTLPWPEVEVLHVNNSVRLLDVGLFGDTVAKETRDEPETAGSRKDGDASVKYKPDETVLLVDDGVKDSGMSKDFVQSRVGNTGDLAGNKVGNIDGARKSVPNNPVKNINGGENNFAPNNDEKNNVGIVVNNVQDFVMNNVDQTNSRNNRKFVPNNFVKNNFGDVNNFAADDQRKSDVGGVKNFGLNAVNQKNVNVGVNWIPFSNHSSRSMESKPSIDAVVRNPVVADRRTDLPTADSGRIVNDGILNPRPRVSGGKHSGIQPDLSVGKTGDIKVGNSVVQTLPKTGGEVPPARSSLDLRAANDPIKIPGS